MSYSKDYRERTIEYRQEGHTLEETHQTFKVAISTIQRWHKRLDAAKAAYEMPLSGVG